nr:PREDICTED: proline-rich receptor-like protein kinase PERK8 isoform X1 [Nicotiana tabacum]
MALSTQPPPLDPPSTTTTTTITTSTIRPIIPNPIRPPTPQPKLHPFSLQSSHYPPTQNQPPQRLPPLSNPNYSQLVPKPPNNPDPPHHLQGFLYPVASSGRGFLPKPSSSNYPNRPVVGSRPPFGLNHMDPGSVPTAGAGVRPTHLQHSLVGSSPTANSAVINGFPVVTSSSHPKIAPTQPSISDCNGFREGRDRSKDDTLAIIRDRKVRISDNASLYALSRSWLRNGLPDETQPQYMDGVRSLPRPLPLAPQDAESPVKKEGDKEEEKEDGGSVEHLSPKELLQRHVKRAKRIRSRLREERLRRIARYKTRLALLLPPMVEQQYKNDLALGN